LDDRHVRAHLQRVLSSWFKSLDVESSNEWMSEQSRRHQLYLLAEVIGELSHPDSEERADALHLVARISLLEIDDETRGFAHILVNERVMLAR
jgi:hypothetical protein